MIQLGYNLNTELPITADILKTGHTCIVGGTGSGKTVGTLYLLYQLHKNNTAELYIGDY